MLTKMLSVRKCIRASLAVQNMGVRSASSWNPFKKDKKSEMYEIAEESEEMQQYQKQLEALERDAREEYIQSKRNKSRLSASDRQILHGKPPYVGVSFQYNDSHRNRDFKQSMLGRYGSKSTGINPGELWPTQNDVELAKEYENLYQPAPLRQMIDDIQLSKEKLIQKRMERESRIEENLEKHDAQLAAWQKRVDARSRLAQGATDRRNRILAELKEEFGYDVNPTDEIMKTRIQDREKVLAKEEREVKKAARAAEKAARATAEAEAKE